MLTLLSSVERRAVTDLFFKINYSPFLLVLDFAHEVVYARAAAAVTDECVVLTFPKATPGVAWGTLAPTPALAKSELLARRSAAAERKAASDAAERERREKTKNDVVCECASTVSHQSSHCNRASAL